MDPGSEQKKQLQECIALRRRVAQLTSSASQLDTIRQSAIRLASSSPSLNDQVEAFTLQLDSASNLYRTRIAGLNTTLDLIQRRLLNTYQAPPGTELQASQSTFGQGETPTGDDANRTQAQAQVQMIQAQITAEESDRLAQLRSTEDEVQQLESVWSWTNCTIKSYSYLDNK